MGVFLSLSNLPFWYVAMIEGRAVDRWGVTDCFWPTVCWHSPGWRLFSGSLVVFALPRGKTRLP